MRMLWVAIVGLGVAMGTPGHAQQTSLAAAASAMGAANLNSIEYSGSGFVFGFGQAYTPGDPWPRFIQRSYVASINYQTPAMRLEQVRAQGEVPPRGGAAQPVAGEQRTVLVVSGRNAWAEGGAQANPQPDAVADRLRQLWVTPHGVIKTAIANGGTVNGNVISVTIEGRPVQATLNGQNLVERVRFLSTNEVIGDYPVEITYSEYADYNGVKFPTRIVQTEDGHPTLDITIREVRPNAPVSITVPANVAQAPAPPATPAVNIQQLAPGVLYLTAAGVSSWAVEFNDYIVVVEGPAGEARSLAVNEAIRRQFPNKPIRYVVNTHAHYDHAGGLRTYVAQGATVITHEVNRLFLEQAWKRPRTIAPDTLSRSPRAMVFETVGDMRVITDGTRRLELYHLRNSGHNNGTLIAFLPAEGLLYYGDGYNPPPGDNPRDPSRTPEYGIDLYRNVMERNLNVQRIAPAHSTRAVPFDNLRIAIGLLSP